jgi:hypothetical protein
MPTYVEKRRLSERLPGLQASTESGRGKHCQHGGDADREMQHLDNLQVEELTARKSLSPFRVSYKQFCDIS